MQLEARKYLEDVRQAAGLTLQFIGGMNFEAYADNPLVKSAVERQFEIIGEGIANLNRLTPEVAAQIGDSRRIIAFRNTLAHRYWAVDPAIVWGIVEKDLPLLLTQVTALLHAENP